jgi:hypothetical protein
MNPNSKQERLPIVPNHRPRPEELWASPQRLRYLRTLTPEIHPGQPAKEPS